MQRLFWLVAPVLILACSGDAPPPPDAEPQMVLFTARDIVGAKASSAAEYKGTVYSAADAFDNNPKTAWCEGVEGLGAGESLSIDLGRVRSIAEIGVQGGFFKDDRTLINNGRVRKMKVESDQGWAAEVSFDFVPERKHQAKEVHVTTTPVHDIGATARVLTFTIVEADKGQFSEDVCVSDVVIYGVP